MGDGVPCYGALEIVGLLLLFIIIIQWKAMGRDGRKRGEDRKWKKEKGNVYRVGLYGLLILDME